MLEIDTFDPQLPFEYQGVCFDATNGSGATGNSSNVNYMGFVAFIRPQLFLQLATHLPSELVRGSLGHFERELPSGWCIAPPQLYLYRRDGGWAVSGHEGRHRAKALLSLIGDEPIPVLIFPQRLRARDVNEDLLESMERILPEGSSYRGLLFRPSYVIVNKKVFACGSAAKLRARLWHELKELEVEEHVDPIPGLEDAHYYYSRRKNPDERIRRSEREGDPRAHYAELKRAGHKPGREWLSDNATSLGWYASDNARYTYYGIEPVNPGHALAHFGVEGHDYHVIREGDQNWAFSDYELCVITWWNDIPNIGRVAVFAHHDRRDYLDMKAKLYAYYDEPWPAENPREGYDERLRRLEREARIDTAAAVTWRFHDARQRSNWRSVAFQFAADHGAESVVTHKGKKKVVRLGWLLRNTYRSGGGLTGRLMPLLFIVRTMGKGKAYLRVHLANGERAGENWVHSHTFETMWADSGVLWDWLHRPTFYNERLDWNCRLGEIAPQSKHTFGRPYVGKR